MQEDPLRAAGLRAPEKLERLPPQWVTGVGDRRFDTTGGCIPGATLASTSTQPAASPRASAKSSSLSLSTWKDPLWLSAAWNIFPMAAFSTRHQGLEKVAEAVREARQKKRVGESPEARRHPGTFPTAWLPPKENRQL